METTINDPVNDQANADNFKVHALSLVKRMNNSGALSAEIMNVLFGAFAELRIMSTINNQWYMSEIINRIYDPDEIAFVNRMTRCANDTLVEGVVTNKAFNNGILSAVDLYDILKELRNGMGNFRSGAIKNMRLFRIYKLTKKNGATVVLDFRMSKLEHVVAMPRMDLVVERMRKPDFVSSYKCFFDIDTAEGFYQFRLYVNLKKEGGDK